MSKMKTIIVLSVTAAVTLTGMLTTIRLCERKDANIITVNNIPVSSQEVKMQIDIQRPGVFDYFRKKYNVENNQEFWEKSYNGERPEDLLISRTVEACTNSKVEQRLMLDEGIINSVSYDSFLKELRKENKARKSKLSRNEIIYGPEQYSEEVFYKVLLDNDRTKLKNALMKEELDLDESTLKEYYEDIKKTYFSLGKLYKVHKIVSSSQTKIDQAKEALDSGEDFDSVAINFNDDRSVQQEVLEEKPTSKVESSDNILPREAQKLKAGQISKIIECADKKFYIIKCVEINDLGYMNYIDVKQNVKQLYIDFAYNEMINNLALKAQVNYDREALVKLIK